MPETLLKIAREYESEADFKKGNLPKYLLAKKRRLIPIAFPKKRHKAHKGIYYLYKDLKVIYIGHSLTDVLEEIQTKQEVSFYWNNYRYFKLNSDADILTLSLYLSQYYKPRYNTNIASNDLSYKIPNIQQILGKPTKGKS